MGHLLLLQLVPRQPALGDVRQLVEHGQVQRGPLHARQEPLRRLPESERPAAAPDPPVPQRYQAHGVQLDGRERDHAGVSDSGPGARHDAASARAPGGGRQLVGLVHALQAHHDGAGVL
uniref:Uncharacterized protein n=1 Tax=Ixodes ricinus TaxID=34613 RepID=A0A6B0UMQ6_IXORI